MDDTILDLMRQHKSELDLAAGWVKDGNALVKRLTSKYGDDYISPVEETTQLVAVAACMVGDITPQEVEDKVIKVLGLMMELSYRLGLEARD